MKNKINKYVLLFIILSSAPMLFPIFQEIFITNYYGGEIPIIGKGILKIIYGVFIFLPDIAAAFWLRYLAQKHNSGTVLWFFFGLVGGLISVAIYYLIRIYEKTETQQANQPDR
jgi:hypothetical protein